MIELYIDSTKADLDGSEKFVFTYQATDFSQPEAVKNSFSKTISLKGTPTNNHIFGHCWNMNRVLNEGDSLIGVNYNANKRVPFILNQNGNTIEKGYIKLTGVKKTGNDITYNITLFGELGDFFYNLAYDEEGETRTLASLYYGFTDASGHTYTEEEENSYIICQWDKDFVNAGWDALTTPLSGNPVCNHIVAAPTYSGLYEDFDNDKVLINTTGMNTASTQFLPTIEGKGTVKGYGLITLPREAQESEIRDYRSAFQRPAIRFKTVFDAITNPKNNGGYNVVLDPELTNTETAIGSLYNKGYILFDRLSFEEDIAYNEAGILTPLTPLVITLGTSEAVIGLRGEDGETTFDFSTYPNPNVVFKFWPAMTTTDAEGYDNIYTSGEILPYAAEDPSDHRLGWACGGYGYRIEVMSGDTMVTCSTWTFIEYRDKRLKDANTFYYIERPKLIPSVFSTLGTTEAETTWIPEYLDSTNGVDFIGETQVGIRCNFPSSPGLSFRIRVKQAQARSDGGTFAIFKKWATWQGGNIVYNVIAVTEVHDCTTTASEAEIFYQNGRVEAQKTNCTKRILLGQTKTPYDYLIGFSRMLGLRYDMDKLAKTIYIRLRKNYYEDEVIDLTHRINRGKEINVTPTLSEAKYYKYVLETPETYAVNLYKRKSNIEYGAYKVDTGYEFSNETDDIFDDTCYKNVIPYQLASFYFNTMQSNGFNIQPCLLSPTVDYTLFSAETGGTYESETVTARAAGSYKTVLSVKDSFPKLCLFDADMNDVTDADNVFVFFNGMHTESRNIILTDNLPIMQTLNENPCYLATESETGYTDTTDVTTSLIAHIRNTIPMFGKYHQQGSKYVLSTDFAKPEYTFIGDADAYQDGITLYDLFWRYYLEDIYNADIKSFTCYAFLPQEPAVMLKKFFLIDSVLYMLNKVTDYNPESKDPVKCEFIKVENMNNYLS